MKYYHADGSSPAPFAGYPAVRVGIMLCLTFLSCGSHDKTDAHTDSTGYKNLILYREDTPISGKEKVLFLRNVARTLHLPLLTGGFQGLYIRIWAWDPGENRFIVDIKKSAKGNAASIVAFLPAKKDSGNYILINERRDLTPGSGWNNFFDTVEKYNIAGLGNPKLSVRQLTRYTEMEHIQVEIDQPDRYQLYEYPEPASFKDEDSVSATICRFIRYLDQEMKTNIYPAE